MIINSRLFTKKPGSRSSAADPGSFMPECTDVNRCIPFSYITLYYIVPDRFDQPDHFRPAPLFLRRLRMTSSRMTAAAASIRSRYRVIGVSSPVLTGAVGAGLDVPPPPPPVGLLTADAPPPPDALLEEAAAEDAGVVGFAGVSGTVGFAGVVGGVVGVGGVVVGVVGGVVGGVVFFGSCLLVISTLPPLSVLPVSVPPPAFVTLYDAV